MYFHKPTDESPSKIIKVRRRDAIVSIDLVWACFFDLPSQLSFQAQPVNDSSWSDASTKNRLTNLRRGAGRSCPREPPLHSGVTAS